MRAELFGKTADGTDIYRVEIGTGGLTARLMSWGATLQDLRLEGHAPPLVLGFDDFDSYRAHSPYFVAEACCKNSLSAKPRDRDGGVGGAAAADDGGITGTALFRPGRRFIELEHEIDHGRAGCKNGCHGS